MTQIVRTFTRGSLFQIEQLVRMELPCVKHAVVIGDDEDYLAVLLTMRY